jgi:ionotropic glutamate receptor
LKTSNPEIKFEIILFFHRILQLLNKRKLEKLKERWWNQNPEKRRDCEKQDDQTDGISIQNIGT